MSKCDLSLIDLSVWKPVQSPGLMAPKHQMPYDSVEVQQVLKDAFNLMFPSIVDGPAGFKRYEVLNESGHDIFPKAYPAKNIGDIPRAEILRMMEGWIRLRRKLQEEPVSSKVAGILLNFRVPNPRQSLDRYMLYKQGDETRLMIRWGYESEQDQAVSLERAISILMDVPLGHMRSILSTSMTPTTATFPVGQMLAASQADEGGQQANNKRGKSSLGLVAAGVVIMVLGGGLAANAFINTASKAESVVGAEMPLAKTEPHAVVVVPVEQEAVLEQAPQVAAAVEQEQEPEESVESLLDAVVGVQKPESADQSAGAVLSLDSMLSGEKAEDASLLDAMLK